MSLTSATRGDLSLKSTMFLFIFSLSGTADALQVGGQNNTQVYGNQFNFPNKKQKPATCQHPDFGQTGWRRTEAHTDSSGRVSGGHDQRWWCNQVISSFIKSRGIGSQHEVKILKSSEEDNKDWKGHVTYKYHCTIRVSWEPSYAEKQHPRCGMIQE